MTFIVCPHCKQGFEHSPSPRICADCGQALTRHSKYKWVVRDGRSTVVHKDCKRPEGGPGFTEKVS